MGFAQRTSPDLCPTDGSIPLLTLAPMSRSKQPPKDLTGIRQRGGTYQVRLFGGCDPVTGKQVMLTGSAVDEDTAISRWHRSIIPACCGLLRLGRGVS